MSWCEWPDSNPHAEAEDFKSSEFTDFSTLAIWCPKRDSNSQDLASKASTYTNSVIGAEHWQGI